MKKMNDISQMISTGTKKHLPARLSMLLVVLLLSALTTMNAGAQTGTTWTSRTSAADNNWDNITYGNGLFVAVAYTGTGNRVMTSPDGITWTLQTSAADNGWTSVTFGNSLFVAVANTGTGNRVMTSPDGITWTIRSSAADNNWYSVTFGNGLFVAVAQTGTGNRVMTSPDGITWTIRTSAANNSWQTVTYGNGLFVAVSYDGAGNHVMTSPNGITWTLRSSAADNQWFSVIYGNGLFVAVAGTGAGNRVMTSPDGITWTIRTSAADNNWAGITYGNGLFVAVAFTGTGNRVMTSPDGITWTIRTSAADINWGGVTYGNGLFVAVAFSGIGNRVMTSGTILLPSIASGSSSYSSYFLCGIPGAPKDCGFNNSGQLGDGTVNNAFSPISVSGLTGIIAMAGGGSHSLFLKADGTVWACGLNVYGQLGDGTTTNSITPVQVHGAGNVGFLTGIIDIKAGGNYSLFLKADGTVWGCGFNGEGELGDNTITNKNTPVQVKGLGGVGFLTGIIAISGGGGYSLFLKNDGTVWSCGYNGEGELGDGTTTQRITPVLVSGLTGIIAISAGGFHSVFLKNNGTVWASGYNLNGQLGDGTTTQRNTPIQVHGAGNIGFLTGITTIAAGQYHTLFLKDVGTVWASGDNQYGELGDNTITASNTPVQVHGPGNVGFLTGITTLAAGQYHSLFLKDDGTVRACGYNAVGQLGNGTGSDSHFPVQVSLICIIPSSSTDYFRSKTSGNWNAPSTWESSPVADFSFGLASPATLSPDNNANDINIRNGQTVTVTANVTTDQTFVNPGGALVVTGSTLTVSSNGLTIQSDATGTGRIGTSTGTISGNVNVERFIAAAGHRAWHLLSGKSVSGAQTIFQSWQEGSVNTAGLGTRITSNLYNGSNGFDQTSISSSILKHNQGGVSGPSWNYNLANTNVTTLSSNQGYMLFVRGDRNYTPTLPTTTAFSATTLRTIGTLNQGTQGAVTVSSTGTGYTLVGNPYMSPIDFELFSGIANLSQSYYIWDAALTGNNGVGGFRLVTRTGVNTYTATPTTGSDNTLRYIASGQAFMLKATGADASVAFTEAHKATLTAIVPPSPNGFNDQQLTVNLFVVGSANEAFLADGLRIRYNDRYSSSTVDDADKISNFGENIYLKQDNHKFIMEDRPMINANDTITLYMSNTGIKDYLLKIEGFDFVQTGIPARLVDRFMGTITNLDLRGNNNYDFSITADPASAVADRFQIIFGVKKADIVTGEKGITIYPNPVSNKLINMKFIDMEKGVYTLRLINTKGQVVMTTSVNHSGTNSIQIATLDQRIANGLYRMEFIKPDKSKIVMALVILNK